MIHSPFLPAFLAMLVEHPLQIHLCQYLNSRPEEKSIKAIKLGHLVSICLVHMLTTQKTFLVILSTSSIYTIPCWAASTSNLASCTPRKYPAILTINTRWDQMYKDMAENFESLKTEINFDASKLQNKIEEIKIKGKRNISKLK